MPLLMVKARLVAPLPLPVNCRVPPLNTKLVSALLDCPKLLAKPPSATLLTLNTPAVIVVDPV